jgi:hypothetical protein
MWRSNLGWAHRVVRPMQASEVAPHYSRQGGHMLVRELTIQERDRLAHAKTGERLSDGSVLLRQKDMDLMGLQRLRSWILEEVLLKGSMVALLDEPPRHVGAQSF